MRQFASTGLGADLPSDPSLNVYTWHVIVQGVAAFATLGMLVYVILRK